VYFWNADGQVLDSSVTGIRNGGPTGTLDGIQHGQRLVGFATDGGPHTVEVGNTDVSDFQKTGILLNGAGLTADVHDSHVTGAGETTVIGQNGIQIGFGATGSVADNTISGIGYGNPNVDVAAGVLVFDAASGVNASGNTITGTAGDGDAGVYFVDSDAPVAHGNTLNGLAFGVVDQGTFVTPVGPRRQYLHPRRRERHQRWLLPGYDRDHGLYLLGTGGFDDLEGGAQTDHLSGLGGNDFIEGFGGDDVLNGGTGSNTLVGDAGIDTATGYAAGATIALSGGHWVVKHDGDTDTLTGVEKVVIGKRDLPAGRSAWRQRRRLPARAGCDRRGAVNRRRHDPDRTWDLHRKCDSDRGIRHRGRALYRQARPHAAGRGCARSGDHHGGRRTDHRRDDHLRQSDRLRLQPLRRCCGHRYCHPRTAPAGRRQYRQQAPGNLERQHYGREQLHRRQHRGATYSFAAAIYFNDNGTTASDNITSYTVDHTSSTRGSSWRTASAIPPTASAPTSSSPATSFVGTFDTGTGEGRYDTVVVTARSRVSAGCWSRRRRRP